MGVRNPCLREVVRVECAAERLEFVRLVKFQSGSALVTVSRKIFVGQGVPQGLQPEAVSVCAHLSTAQRLPVLPWFF